MNIRLAAVGAVAAVLVLAGCSSDSDSDEAAAETTSSSPSPAEETSEAPAEDPGTIVDVAAANPDFETLVAAVTAADLGETLSSEGPFTVFAPTDEAFEALPEGLLDALLLPKNKEVLTSILTYHVLPAEVMAADVSAGEVDTVEGSAVDITTDDGVKVNDATVVTADVVASNGVIHAIDAVLVPPSVDVNALLN